MPQSRDRIGEAARAIAPVVSGDRLKTARSLRVLTLRDLSDRLGGSPTPAALSQFETEVARPRPTTLRALSEALDVPVEFFARDETVEEQRPAYFRSLRKTSARDREQAAAQAYLVYLFTRALEDHVRLPPLDVPRIELPLETDPREAAAIAAKVRDYWGVSAGPVKNVVELLESKGIAVVRLAGVNETIDAFSVAAARPVVVLGADKGDAARSRFDASHEPGHLVMHGVGACGDKRAEAQAHAFAAEFLMPAEDIADELPRTLNWQRFLALKFEWRVSIQALVRRAHDLGRIDPRTYDQALRTISARGWRRPNGEPGHLGRPEQPTVLITARELAEGAGASLDEITARVGLPLAEVLAFLDETEDNRPAVSF